MIEPTVEPTTENKIAPVLFLVFNRPKQTREVFEAIRKAKPGKLYIAADGPRKNKRGEEIICENTRKVAAEVDWNCQVTTLFRDENLGCGRAVSEAISWFFEHETEGIILEDDCVPSKTFFRFCTELLQYYRNDARVMQIGGSNFHNKYSSDNEYSYSFSNQSHIWGWATWKRAWSLYDFKMLDYKQLTRKKYLKKYYDTRYEYEYKKWVFDKTIELNTLGTWDYQWEFAMIIHAGLKIVPQKNLIINIGFGEDATHTIGTNKLISEQKLEEMDFPLVHPDFMMVDKRYDNLLFKSFFATYTYRLKSDFKRLIYSTWSVFT